MLTFRKYSSFRLNKFSSNDKNIKSKIYSHRQNFLSILSRLGLDKNIKVAIIDEAYHISPSNYDKMLKALMNLGIEEIYCFGTMPRLWNRAIFHLATTINSHPQPKADIKAMCKHLIRHHEATGSKSIVYKEVMIMSKSFLTYKDAHIINGKAIMRFIDKEEINALGASRTKTEALGFMFDDAKGYL
jgi:hypothetical protein